MPPRRVRRVPDTAQFDLMVQDAARRELIQRNVDAFAERSYKAVTKKREAEYERVIKKFLLSGKQHPQPDTWPTLEPGSAVPDRTHLKWFATWLLNACQGYIGPPIEVNGNMRAPLISARTLRTYIATLLEALRRRGFNVAREDAADARAYVLSEAFKDLGTLTTAMFPKHHATRTDLMHLIIQFWCSPGIRTSRMRMQLAFGLLVASETTSRPGAIWESTTHKGSNEALLYDDIGVFVMQHPERPDGLGVPVLRLSVRLLKGMRYEDSKYVTVYLFPEPDADRIFCPVHLLFALALEDGAFADVQTMQEALDVSKYPTHMRHLAWAPQWKSVPIMREEVPSPDGGWTISSKRAMSARTARHHFNLRSDEAGLEHRIHGYCTRRGSSQEYDKVLPQSDRELIMGHTIESPMFQDTYRARTLTVDLGAILGGREQSSLHVALADRVESMSRIVLPNAPRVLTAQQRLEISQDPEIVACDEGRKKALEKAAQYKTELSRLGEATDDESEEIIARREQLDVQRKEALALALRFKKDRENLFTAERLAVIKESRQAVFDEVTSGRCLPSEIDVTGGVQSDITIPDALQGASTALWKKRSSPLDLAHVTKCTFNFPLDRYLAVIASVGQFDGEQFLESIETLLALPAQVSNPTYKAFYTGESPAEGNRCPFESCNIVLVREPGRHVHQCAEKAAALSLLTQLEDEYEPRPCPMQQCKKKRTTIFTYRAEFVKHVATHFHSQYCKWQDDDWTCQHLALDWTASDWARHIAEEHRTNVFKNPSVKFCFLCHEWFPDVDGTGAQWEQHLLEHYEELFAASSTCPDTTDEVFPPISPPNSGGLLYLRRFHNVKDQRPILHGVEQRFITQRPWFCPECLYNEALPMALRMYQYRDAFTLRRHMGEHYKNLDISASECCCPVPACGRKIYDPVGLMDHLVTVHALPVLGSLQQWRAHVPFTSAAPSAKFPFAHPAGRGDTAAGDDTTSAGQKRSADGDIETQPALKRRRTGDDDDAADTTDNGGPTAGPSTSAPAGRTKRRKGTARRDAARRRQQYSDVPEFWCHACHRRRPVVQLRAHVNKAAACRVRSKVAICEIGVKQSDWLRYSVDEYFSLYPEWDAQQVDESESEASSDDEDDEHARSKKKALQWLRLHTKPGKVPKRWTVPPRPQARQQRFGQARFAAQTWFRSQHPAATIAQFWHWLHTNAGGCRFWDECQKIGDNESVSDDESIEAEFTP